MATLKHPYGSILTRCNRMWHVREFPCTPVTPGSYLRYPTGCWSSASSKLLSISHDAKAILCTARIICDHILCKSYARVCISRYIQVTACCAFCKQCGHLHIPLCHHPSLSLVSIGCTRQQLPAHRLCGKCSTGACTLQRSTSLRQCNNRHGSRTNDIVCGAKQQA